MSIVMRLVKLVARAFYDDDVTDEEKDKDKEKEKEKEKEKDKGASRKAERICGGETKGLTIVVLDALTRRQWMREEELARQLHLHPKQLRRTLKMLEEELMIVREHRKEVSAVGCGAVRCGGVWWSLCVIWWCGLVQWVVST
ncbi:unnamed protein product [Closterium sp. NIES-54]